LKYAVREQRLSANPLDGAKLDREWKAPDVEQAVDRRRVASPAQMRLLLDAIRSTGKSQGARLVALFGCMYYGMLRPSEAVSLLLDEWAELARWPGSHSAYIPGLPTFGGFWRHTAAQPFNGRQIVCAAQAGYGLLMISVPSRIRTCAHGSGG
jgi:integrase